MGAVTPLGVGSKGVADSAVTPSVFGTWETMEGFTRPQHLPRPQQGPRRAKEASSSSAPSSSRTGTTGREGYAAAGGQKDAPSEASTKVQTWLGPACKDEY